MKTVTEIEKERKRLPFKLVRRVCAVLAVFAIAALCALSAFAEQQFDCAEGRHNYIATLRIPPTEEENGEVHYVCVDCGLEWTEILYSIGHEWGPWIVRIEAGCEEPGELYRVCANGLTHYEFQESPALGHDYIEESTAAPGCETDGWTIFTCSRCGDSYIETTPATGHTREETIISEPDCETDGIRAFVCTLCGDSITETILALGHTREETVIIEPGCETEGKITYICTRCGDSYSEAIAATGHEYEITLITTGSCEQQGERIFTCSICGDSYTEIIPAGQHDYSISVYIEPTCGVEGKKTFVCILCGDSYTEIIPALEHEYGEWYVETPSKEGIPGVEARVCAHNASHIETREIPALPVPPLTPAIDVVETVIEGTNLAVFAFFVVLLFPYFRWLFFIYKKRKAAEKEDERKKAVAKRYEFE